MATQTGLTVGIDLGTSNTVVAFVGEDGRPEVVKNSSGSTTTPSVVFGEPPHFTVGEVALESMAGDEAKVIRFVKRSMGKTRSFRLGDLDCSPEFISSLILRKVVSDTEQSTGQKVTGAVISVPAYFGEVERRATFNAARLAGVPVLRLINEPTAAALAYGISHHDEPGFVLVYDLGGGTFDVTVLAIKPESLDVISVAGDPSLGGMDFDQAIFAHLKEQVELQAEGRVLWDFASESELRQKSETVKRHLTGRESAPVPLKVTVLCNTGHEKSWSMRLDVKREQMEGVCAHLLSRTAIITEEALRRANLGWDDIRHVLCVGGSSRMPAVRRTIEKLAGRPPLLHDPDECVAKGAALQAAILAKSPRAPETRIGHVLPRPLGVAAMRRGQTVVDHIVPQLTPLPCAQVRHGYTTSVDFQKSVQVPIYEGESTELAAYAHGPIGTIQLDINPPRRKGQPNISVEFQCDENGFIVAVAKDLDSGTESSTTIALMNGLSDIRFDAERALASTITIC